MGIFISFFIIIVALLSLSFAEEWYQYVSSILFIVCGVLMIFLLNEKE